MLWCPVPSELWKSLCSNSIVQPCTGEAIPSQECRGAPPPPPRSRNEDCIQANCDLTREGKICDQLCPRVTTQKWHPTGGEKALENWQECSPVEVAPEGVCSYLKGRLSGEEMRSTVPIFWCSELPSFLPLRSLALNPFSKGLLCLGRRTLIQSRFLVKCYPYFYLRAKQTQVNASSYRPMELQQLIRCDHRPYIRYL